MGQLVNVTNVNSNVAGTLGVNALTGWTLYTANDSELPEGSASTGYLVQTDPAVAPTLRIDNTATVFAGGNTYHRISLWVKLMRYDQEVTTLPTNYNMHTSGGSNFLSSFAGTGVRIIPNLLWVAPDADSARYTGALGGFVYNMVYQGAGTEGCFNHIDGGQSFNAAGSATGVSNSYTAPNFPVNEWIRMDVSVDLDTLRAKLFLNGYMTGMISLKVATNPPTEYTWTLPVIAGHLWALERMSSWGDTDPDNDTGLTYLTDSRNWKSWGTPPTMANLNDVQYGLRFLTPTNGAWLMIPYSIASGNDPQRILATFTSTGAASAPVVIGGQPMDFNSDGVFIIDTHIRMGQADTGSGTAGQGLTFTCQFSGLNPSFFVEYTGGHYVMTDASGAVLGTWDLNETVNWKLAIYQNGTVFSTIYNQSKNACSTAASTSIRVSLTSGDAAPSTSFSLIGVVESTATGAKFGIESVNGYARDCVLLTDSFVEATNQGATATVVTLWATAARASLNRTSLILATSGQADCNVHGMSTVPYGFNMPRICFSAAWGRSGNKISDWYTNNLANGALNDWYGSWVFLLGGLTNELSAVSNEATSISVAATVSAAIINTARHRLDRLAGFVWLRTAIPPYRPSAGLPSAAFETEWKRDCFYRINEQVAAGLLALQQSHTRGQYCVVIDGGAPDFDDLTTGVHLGIPGTQAALVAALPQLAAKLGESYMNQGGGAAPSVNGGGGSSRRKILPIPC